MFIEQGHVDVNEVPIKNPEYPTLRHALGEATFYENIDFVEYLLDHGADLSIRLEKDGFDYLGDRCFRGWCVKCH